MPTDPSPSSDRIRFEDFEVALRSHELLRFGRRIRLQEKSFLVLNELLKRPGQVVTREELAAALWPKEYFVDAEHGLNTAVRRLREALGDSAEQARYIETLPKLGYRFIGGIEAQPEPSERPAAADPAPMIMEPPPPPSPGATPPPPIPRSSAPPTPRRSFHRRALLAAILIAVAFAVAVALVTRSRSARRVSDAAAQKPLPATAATVEELLARARYLRNHKRLAEARQFVEEALKLEPGNPDALAGLALAYLADGEHDKARETARRALELDPNAWEAHRALGNLARRAGDFAGAERHLRHGVESNPTDYKTRNRYARHLLECGRLEEAKAQILETRRLAPDDPDVQNIWMQYALLTGDYESAVHQGEIWIAIWGEQLTAPSVAAVREMLGLAYVGARRHEEALAQFRAIDPSDDLRVALALGYAGRLSEARAILDTHEAAAGSPGAPPDPSLTEGMAMARIVTGDFDRAFAHLDRLVAARWYPSWLHLPMFHPIRRDARWPAFAELLEREFFRGKEDWASPTRPETFARPPLRPGAADAPPSGS